MTIDDWATTYDPRPTTYDFALVNSSYHYAAVLMLLPTLEELVRTSDHAAVRARYDARNRIWLAPLALGFLVVAFVSLMMAMREGGNFRTAIAATQLILAVLNLAVLRDLFRMRKGKSVLTGRFAPVAERSVSAIVIAAMVSQYALILLFSSRSEGWIPWAMTFPFFALGFRLFTNELVLMHLSLAAGGVVVALLFSPAQLAPVIVGVVLTNAIVLGIEAWLSRRMRREVVADFTHRRSQATEQLRMREELQYARELQLSMLPEAPPQLEWVDVTGISIPATEVGGDYYDFFADRDRLALVCADVAGHGLPSGIVLSAIRSGLILLRDSLGKPEDVIRRLHDLVLQASRRRLLATITIVVLDRSRQVASVATAGHPPLLHRAAGGTVTEIALPSPPLGVRLPFQPGVAEVPFAPGDMFVLYSDGVDESRRSDGAHFGDERLRNILAASGDRTAESFRDRVLADLEEFRAGAPITDDVTIVAARILP